MQNWLYILHRHWLLSTATVSVTLASISFEAFSIGMLLPIIQLVLNSEQDGTFKYLVDVFFKLFNVENSLKTTLYFFCSMVFLKTIFITLREHLKSRLGYSFKQHAVSQLNQQLFCKGYSDIIRSPHGNHVDRIIVETQSVSQGLIQLTEIIISILYVLFLTLVAFLTDFNLALWATVTAVIFFALTSKGMSAYSSKVGTEEVFYNQELSRVISENVALNKEIRVSRMTEVANQRVTDIIKKLKTLLVNWDTITSSITPIIELLLAISFTVFIVVSLTDDPSSIGQVFATLSVFGVIGLKLLQKVARLSTSLMAVNKYSAPLELIISYLKEPTIQNIRQRYELKAVKSIQLDGVTIYGHSNIPTLKNIDMIIEENHVIALVGPSGSGKSSLIETIMGLRENFTGKVSINGMDLSTIEQESIFQNISLTSQDINLFNVSLRENIVCRQQFDEKRLNEVCQRAFLTDFLPKLPHGLETIVGERGNLLSGGQKQRVLIARALYSNASMLILDEPSSSLDNFSEQRIFECLRQLKGEKTIVISTHRPSLLKLADTVYRIEGQKIHLDAVE
jgi:ABC-type multidrug transport system fused ATPase/permease subunit